MSRVQLKIILVVAVLWAAPAMAQVEAQHHGLFRRAAGHTAHYVLTHKLPLLADTIDVLGAGADAESTIWAEHHCGACVDEGLFGNNPTRVQAWAQAGIGPALGIAMNHLAYHHYRKGGDDPSVGGQRFWTAFFTVPIAVHAYADTIDNVKVIYVPQGNAPAFRLKRGIPVSVIR
jgi:hypothetical protein